MSSEKNIFGTRRAEDPAYQNLSPNRSCTDVIWCIIFILSIAGAVAISIIGYLRGDPAKLLHPTDSAGRYCGYGDLADRPFLFYFDLLQCMKVASGVVFGCPTPQVCVAQCPSTYFTYIAGSRLETGEEFIRNLSGAGNAEIFIKKSRQELICKEGVDSENTKESISSLIRSEKCAPYYVPSTPVLNRCIPSMFNDLLNVSDSMHVGKNPLKNKIGDVLTGGKLSNATRFLAQWTSLNNHGELLFKDLMVLWKQILIGLGIVLAVTFLWIIVLRLIITPIVLVSIMGFIATFTFCSYYSMKRYLDLEEGKFTAQLGLPTSYVSERNQFLVVKNTWLVLGSATAVIGFFLVLVSLFVLKHIRVAVHLIRQASKAILQMPLVVLWPLVPFAMQMTVVMFWVVSAVHVATIGEKEYAIRNVTDIEKAIKSGDVKGALSLIPCERTNSSLVDTACEFIKYGGNDYSEYLQGFLLFVCFWLMNFMVALDQLTLSGAFCIYFWTFNKNRSFFSAIFVSFYNAIRYHLGSLALGSLILAIVQMIRVALEFVDHKLRKANNKFAQFIIKCMKCCVWCIETFLKFLNKNAYIMIAIYGRNFWTSSKEAFLILMRNIVRAGVLNTVVGYISIISKLLITSVTGFASYLWFVSRLERADQLVPDLNFNLLPVIIMIVGAYVVSSILFSVVDMAVDTLFLCLLEDIERNDGSPEKPYYMSVEIRNLLGLEMETSARVRTLQ